MFYKLYLNFKNVKCILDFFFKPHRLQNKCLPEGLLQCESETFVWFHRAASDGESPARSPPGLTQVLISAEINTKSQDPKF